MQASRARLEDQRRKLAHRKESSDALELKPEPPPRPADDIDCPMCAERVRAKARRCRFCGHRLGGAPLRGGRRPSRARQLRLAGDAASAASASLVCGLLSLVVCAPIFAPLAILKGNEAVRLAAAAHRPPPGGAVAGRVIGWANVSLMAAGLVLAAVVIAMGP